MAKNTKKQNALGSIASIQTILERYPVLITNDTVGKTSLSFTFDLLEMLGITPDDILEWLSGLLSVENGLLTTLEYAIKSILIASFKDTYTCSINPTLPYDTMYSIHTPNYPNGSGIRVNLDDIDVFGLLNHCPTSEKGKVFYFDSDPDDRYTPTSVYSSTDFNAYLWYVINKGQNPPQLKSVWDNRVDYKKKFQNKGEFDENKNPEKYRFFNTSSAKTPLIKVPGVGTKKEILSCAFFEQGVGKNSNYLTVYVNYDRYGNFLSGKTIFEFNFDYIMSLKLFDSKTLVAQIINAVAGISSHLNVNILSLSHEVIAAQIKEIVTKVVENEDDVSVEDCYYAFSNDEYNRLLNEAMEKFKGNTPLPSEKTDYVVEKVNQISNSPKGEQTDKIVNAFKTVTEEVSKQDYSNGENVSIGYDIIRKFLEETVLQITLQVLSPKIMLLYAINEKILDPESDGTTGIFEFFKKFSNLILSLIKQIFSLVMEYLAEFLMKELKNILYLFIEKIMLEKIIYYTMLIEQLFSYCSMGIGNISLNFSGSRNDPLVIEDVKGADIVPKQDKPTTNEC